MVTMSRRIPIFALVLSLMVIQLAPALLAGSSGDPELEDISDDADHEFRDILKVWLDDEQNSTLRFNMQLNGQAPARQFGDLIMGMPTYEYSIYFTSKGVNYSVVWQIQYAISSPIAYTLGAAYLRVVEYQNETDSILSESNGTAIGNYDLEDNNVMWFEVQKLGLGSPNIGDTITHLWAAVWNLDDVESSGPKSPGEAVDSAGSFLDPGREYTLTGGFQYLYRVSISAAKLNATVAPGASVNITVRVNATSENPNGSMVELAYSTSSNWTIQIIGGEKTITGSSEFDVIVKITPRANAINGSQARVTVVANLYVEEGGRNATLSSNELVLTAVASIPPATGGGGGFMEQLMDFLFSSIIGLGLIIGIAVVIVFAVLLSMRKK